MRGRVLLFVLALEKTVQHAVVSWAFAADAFELRTDVAVDYRWLLALGALAGALYALALLGLRRRRRWSLWLLAGLALFDLVGELVAQGTLAIAITLSWVVALVVLLLSVRALRGPQTT